MPDNTIDSLAIEVSSNVSNASKSIDDLCNKLNRLSSRMSESIKHLRDFSASVGAVNSAVQSLNNISSISSQLSQLSQSMSTLGSLNLRDTGLNSFVNAIRRLNETLNSTGNVSGKIQNMISELSTLGSIPDVSNNVNRFVSSLARLANAGGSIDAVISKLPKLGEELRKIITSFAGIGNISQPINTFVQSIAQLANAGDKTGKTAAQLNNLANSLKTFFQTMSTAPRISNSTIRMTQAIAQLANAGGNTGRAARSTAGAFSRLGQGAAASTGKVRKLGNAVGNVGSKARKSLPSIMSLVAKFWTLKFVVGKFGSAIESSMNFLEDYNYFQAAFRQVADKAGETWSEAGYDSAEAYANSFSNRARELTSKMSGFDVSDNAILTANKSGKSLGMDPSMLLNYQGQFAQLSSSMGTTSEQALKLSNALTMIGADLASVKNLDFKTVYENLSSGLVGMSRAVDKYGANIRVANLQQYASNLGLQTAVSKMDQASKAMLRTIVILDSTRYAWADMANTINMPANQLRILRANLVSCARALGNIFMPVIAAVLPYINGLVIAFQRLLTYIGSLLGVDTKIGKMFGSIGGGSENLSNALDSIDDSGISDVDDATKDTNNNLKNATKSAKKLKQFLASYDELEIMSKDDSSLSNLANSKIKTPTLDTSAIDAGILNDALDKLLNEYQKKWDAAYNSMENKAMAFANKVTDTFKKLAKVAEPTTRALKNLWNNGLKQLKDFTWTALKDFWNHFLVPLGKWTLGEKGLPRLINAFNDFLMKINWDKINASLVQLWDVLEPFAENVGTGLLDFFDDFFDKAADGVNKLPDLIDRFKEFIATFSPKQAQSIGYFLGQLLTAFVAFKGLTWFGSIFGKNGAIGKGIAMLAAHPYASIAAGLGLTVAALDKFGVIDADWTQNGQSLNAFISDLIDALISISGKVDWEEFGRNIGTFLSQIDWGTNLQKLGTVLLDVLGGIWSGLGETSAGKFVEAVIGFGITAKLLPVVTSIGSVFASTALASKITSSVATAFSGAIGLFQEGGIVYEAFLSASTSLAGALSSLTGLSVPVGAAAAGIAAAVAGVIASIADLWNTSESFRNTVGIAFEKIKDSIVGAFEKVKTAISPLGEAFVNLGSQLYNFYANSGLKSIVSFFETLVVSVGGTVISTGITVLGDAFSGLISILQSGIDVISDVFKIINGFLTLDFSEIGEGFVNLASDIVGAFKNILGSIWDIGTNIILGLFGGVKDAAKDIGGWFKENVVDKIISNVKNLFGIHSPSTVFADIGGYLIEGLKNGVSGAMQGALDVFTNLKENITGILDGITSKVKSLWNKITGKDQDSSSSTSNSKKVSGTMTENYEKVAKDVKEKVHQMRLDTVAELTLMDTNVRTHFTTQHDIMVAKWKQAGEAIVSYINGTMKLNVSKAMNGVVDVVLNSMRRLYTIGWNAIIGLNNGMIAAANQHLYKNAEAIAHNIENRLRSALKIHSPSQVMMELGGFTVEGFQLGMQNMLPKVEATINDISAEVQKINTPTADIITKSASYQEVKSRMSVDTDDFVDDIRKEVMAISSNTFDNNQMIGQAVKNALNGMAIYADGHLIGYLKEENQQFRNRNGYGLFEG